MNAVLLVQLDVDAAVKLLAELKEGMRRKEKEGNGGGGLRNILFILQWVLFSQRLHTPTHTRFLSALRVTW